MAKKNYEIPDGIPPGGLPPAAPSGLPGGPHEDYMQQLYRMAGQAITSTISAKESQMADAAKSEYAKHAVELIKHGMSLEEACDSVKEIYKRAEEDLGIETSE